MLQTFQGGQQHVSLIPNFRFLSYCLPPNIGACREVSNNGFDQKKPVTQLQWWLSRIPKWKWRKFHWTSADYLDTFHHTSLLLLILKSFLHFFHSFHHDDHALQRLLRKPWCAWLWILWLRTITFWGSFSLLRGLWWSPSLLSKLWGSFSLLSKLWGSFSLLWFFMRSASIRSGKWHLMFRSDFFGLHGGFQQLQPSSQLLILTNQIPHVCTHGRQLTWFIGQPCLFILQKWWPSDWRKETPCLSLRVQPWCLSMNHCHLPQLFLRKKWSLHDLRADCFLWRMDNTLKPYPFPGSRWRWSPVFFHLTSTVIFQSLWRFITTLARGPGDGWTYRRCNSWLSWSKGGRGWLWRLKTQILLVLLRVFLGHPLSLASPHPLPDLLLFHLPRAALHFLSRLFLVIPVLFSSLSTLALVPSLLPFVFWLPCLSFSGRASGS